MYRDLHQTQQQSAATRISPQASQRVLQSRALRGSTVLHLATAAGLASILALAGCGNQYRPVVSAINPVGPAGQPTKYAVAVSSPSTTTAGLATFVDFSGDTVLSTPSILANPNYFALNNGGNEGFVINASGSLNDFATSNPTALITSEIVQTTLPASSAPVSISAITPYNGTSSIFVPQTATSSIAVLSTATSSLLQQLTVAANPVYVVGADNTPRVYAISQGAGGNGSVAAIEATSTSSLSISTTIPVGASPVYGVMTSDDRRAYIMNKGSGTVSVLNVVNNALDATTPTITLPTISYPAGSNAGVAYAAGTSAPNPVWADISTTSDQLVVLNQGDGVHPGSLSIIGIPLCSSITQPSNPLCSSTNPTDATGFGTITNTVNVGVNPVMVSVLQDGTAAYVVNAGIKAGVNAAYPNGVEGSISVVSLVNGVVTATIPALSTAAATPTTASSAGYVFGHPNSVSATVGTPTGKVYVTSGDSQYLSILYTNTNTIQEHVNLQGLGLRVLVTSP
ncbi:YncE family protein [Granulicella paludicola]|uniref:YncE family protein n=1 Tax=Granulicella paludicola TaxID=474951 RepID=UPI0021E0816E|nr:beta-propeller fold lactonase family protein [Granulicella paludicola]